jgi:hypothetical protein
MFFEKKKARATNQNDPRLNQEIEPRPAGRLGLSKRISGAPWLDVGQGWTLRLREGDLRTHQQCSQAQVGQWQDDVEIFPHITMMQQVMAVEPEENSRTFHVPFLGQMHAPMHVFVSREIHSAGHRRAAQNPPFVREQRPHQKRQLAQRHDDRPVPPRHRNGFFVRLIRKMIRVVGFENVMMHERVSFKGIAKKFHHERTVHEITVQRPFEQGAESGSGKDSDGAPKKERDHKINFTVRPGRNK